MNMQYQYCYKKRGNVCLVVSITPKPLGQFCCFAEICMGLLDILPNMRSYSNIIYITVITVMYSQNTSPNIFTLDNLCSTEFFIFKLHYSLNSKTFSLYRNVHS